ncbi:uncharacterized protein PG986_004794 [Apiospora aurea]|uniref:Receptor L-domain domain-containing protein n=1 Tax=Apiospora aurea TaxID=335848 RepID=A0ABR1QNK4_9PEZI
MSKAAVGEKGCQVIDQDVVLASDATGDISLDDIDFIEGSLRSENGSQVMSFRHEGILDIYGELILRDMSKLQTVDFRNLLQVGDCYGTTSGGKVVLKNLYVVFSIDLPELTKLSGTRTLVLRDLLRTYLHPNTTHGDRYPDGGGIDSHGREEWVDGYCRTGGLEEGWHHTNLRHDRCMADFETVAPEGNISNDFFEDFQFAFWGRGGDNFETFRHEARAIGSQIDIWKHGRVAERFEVVWTDPGLNCSAMDELRGVALFPGVYSCNRRTAPVRRDAGAEAERRHNSAGRRRDGAVGGLVMGLAVLLQVLVLY